jgi:hypothetical protein
VDAISTWAEKIALQVDLAAALIACLALVISIWVSRRQARLEIEALRLQRDSDVAGWSNRAINSLCEAEMILRQEFRANASRSDYELRRLSIMAALSACVDEGRLYFPNVENDKYGLHKESAYRGIRHAALDQLVWTYDLLKEAIQKDGSGIEGEKEAELKAQRKKITDFKREFVSLVQSEVDPKRRVYFLTERR